VLIELLEKLRKRVPLPSMVQVVHGGGSSLDWIAQVLAHHMGMSTEVHHAHWQRDGERAGEIRNQKMVNLGAKMMFFFPLDEDCEDALDCATRAEKAGIPVMTYDSESGKYVKGVHRA